MVEINKGKVDVGTLKQSTAVGPKYVVWDRAPSASAPDAAPAS